MIPRDLVRNWIFRATQERQCLLICMYLFVGLIYSKGSQVIIKTTAGDLDIELWPKEAPKVTIKNH
jgi:hypothetical protein